MSYRLKFDPDKCVGCYACHIACLDAHHDVEDVDAKEPSDGQKGSEKSV